MEKGGRNLQVEMCTSLARAREPDGSRALFPVWAELHAQLKSGHAGSTRPGLDSSQTDATQTWKIHAGCTPTSGQFSPSSLVLLLFTNGNNMLRAEGTLEGDGTKEEGSREVIGLLHCTRTTVDFLPLSPSLSEESPLNFYAFLEEKGKRGSKKCHFKPELVSRGGGKMKEKGEGKKKGGGGCSRKMEEEEEER